MHINSLKSYNYSVKYLPLCFSHSMDEETEAQRIHKLILLESIKAKIQVQETP